MRHVASWFVMMGCLSCAAAEGIGPREDSHSLPSDDAVAATGQPGSVEMPSAEPLEVSTCVPRASCPAAAQCGTIPDGCGGVISCGTCRWPLSCGGGGNAFTCGQADNEIVFAPPAFAEIAAQPREMEIGDLDRDGLIDVVTANVRETTVTALRATPAAGMETAWSYTLPRAIAHVVVDDFDGNGGPDVAAVVRDPDAVFILHIRDGVVSTTTELALAVSPNSVTAMDTDGDGISEIVVGGADGSISLVKRDEQGVFSEAVHASLDAAVRATAVTDLDGDGERDLVATTASGYLAVLMGTGNGLAAPASTWLCHGANRIRTGELTGDVRRDVAVTCDDDQSVRVLRGSGDGTLQPFASLAMSVRPSRLAVADLDGDQVDEIVVTADDNLVHVLHWHDGRLADCTTLSAGARPGAVALADVNQDWKPEMIVVDQAGALGILALANP